MNNLKNIAYFFITAISIVIILIFGRSLIIPLVFAFLFWFIVRQIRTVMDKISFIKKRFPIWLKSILSLILILTVLNFVLNIVLSNITLLVKSYKNYEVNTALLMQKINDTFDINLVESMKIYIADFDFGAILLSIFNFSTNILSSTFMVILYTLFIFLEETSFMMKIKKAFPRNKLFNRTYRIVQSIEKSISRYLGLKTLISLITGFLSYTVLLIIGVEYPVFWAFIIFILNFIPTIGSLAATLFPVFFSMLQFGEFMPGLLVLVFVGAIQIFVGNILEPKLMGSSMNLSPLATIIALSFWSAVWGITGMILCVPIMVIVVIILSQFPQTRPIAIMLSEKGIIK